MLVVRDHAETFRMPHRQLDGEGKAGSELVEENQRLSKKIDQLKLELRLERQNRFATNKQKTESGQADEIAPRPAKKKRKRAAPTGHPGWYRQTPTQYDIRVNVPAPGFCSHCQTANIAVYTSQTHSEHLQEDFLDGRYHVALFVHPSRCRDCGIVPSVKFGLPGSSRSGL